MAAGPRQGLQPLGCQSLPVSIFILGSLDSESESAGALSVSEVGSHAGVSPGQQGPRAYSHGVSPSLGSPAEPEPVSPGLPSQCQRGQGLVLGRLRSALATGFSVNPGRGLVSGRSG